MDERSRDQTSIRILLSSLSEKLSLQVHDLNQSFEAFRDSVVSRTSLILMKCGRLPIHTMDETNHATHNDDDEA